jgi:ATP/maltotriose-dependent transcriptional regulator MalT
MPAMRRALDALKEATRNGSHGWFWRAFPLAHECLLHETWDDGWHDIAAHAVQLATDSGALTLLPPALLSRAGAAVERGELATAGALAAEANDLALAIDYTPLKYHRIILSAWRGDEAEATRLATAALESGRARGEGRVIGLAHYATAVLNNGLGRYAEARTAARSACEYDDLGFHSELLVEAVEAAVRADDREYAEQVFDRLQVRASAAGSPRALAALARSRALLSEGKQAETLYLESIERFEATSQRIRLARARLLYGEWLRRNGPATVAREPLRLAHQEFVQMGSMAFAERARRELLAAGQKTRKQPTAAGDELSPQERQIAELAGQGLTNQEIAGQLFISAHTVEWHLRKVFTKLGIRSRRDLRKGINQSTGPAPSAARTR